MRVEVGDIVTVKGYKEGYFKVWKFLPKGTLGLRCRLVEVLHSQSGNFEFSFIKFVKLADLRKTQKPIGKSDG